MKRISLAGLVLGALCSFLQQAAQAETKTFATPPDQGKQTWFLGVLKTLADTAPLNDPVKVGATLGVKFNKTVVTSGPSHAEAFANSFERDEYTPIDPTWFTSGPPGYASTGNFKPNGHNGFVAGIDPTAMGTKVNLKYFESKRFGLPDENFTLRADVPKNDTHTTVIFYGIDKLTCITRQDIESFFPEIHHMGATDASSERYLYYPPAREESGSVLSFEALGEKCLTEATVSEFSGFGKRIKRAILKFAKCLQDAGTAFCRAYPNAAPRDFSIHDQLKFHLRENCGSLDAFYEKEPRNSQEPQGQIDYFNIPAQCPYPDKGLGH
ncbi:exported protein of unknown function [Ralstonia solanacearum CMR15]|nr:exported protein of unknown function [Ralstonia solanacearum CMR15]